MVYNSVGYHSVCYIFLFTISLALYKTKQQNVRIKSVAPLASRQNFLILKSYWYMTLLECPTVRNS